MKKQSFKLLPRLDISLNAVLTNPDGDNPSIGYIALEGRVDVLIEAPNRQAPIQNVSELAEGSYTGRISVDYLHELAYREDITMICSKKTHQLQQ